MPRAKIIVGLAVIIAGITYLFAAGFQNAQATHLTVSKLMAKGGAESWENIRLQMGGNVVEGSIQWDKFRHRPTFLVAEGGKTLTVRYVGNNMVPDTFKDGSPVVLEGRYVVGEGVFAAEVIMAKCPSKYEGQDYEGHTAARGNSG